ncbi:MAG TPA: VIT domain-containing protein [Gemmatimonadaceae bacterium]
MRALQAGLLSLLVTASVGAQGRLVPRPCAEPPICRDGRCIEISVVRQCLTVNAIVRTSSQVRVEMVDRVLKYEVSETFVNTGRGRGEADYLFPLPTGSAFEDLKLSINGELVSGETMNAADARRIYEDIVRRQRDPALVEWMGSGLLRARIFPINPGEEKQVVVRFQSIARREGDALRIDYVRGTEPASAPIPVLRAGVSGTLTEESGNSFVLRYPTGRDHGAPYSPTHRLSVRDIGSRRHVTASGDSREVTILLPLRRSSSAAVSVLTHRLDGEAGFALITITPPVAAGRTTPRDVTFVLDVSGSMRGQKLSQATAAGRALLETLDGQDRFRLIDFATDVRSFRDGFVAATPANLRAARRYLDELRAEGSTNISAALQEALQQGDRRERLHLVVFLTDGEPTVGERNPDAIAALAARERGNARVFTVGVSADVNAMLIERLAVEGRGTAHFVRGDENVERPVSVLASRLTNPLLTDVRVRASGVRLTQVMPQLPVDVFAGQDLVLLARYEGEGAASVRVEGRSAGGPVAWSTRATFPRRSTANRFVPRLWAAQRIGWLAAEKRRNGGNSEMNAEIKSLGERYGIPTEFSSYLVLEPGMHVAADRAAAMAPVLPAAVGSVRARPDATVNPAVAGGRSGNEARFEMARQAAAQREARSLSEVNDMATAAAAGALRQVGTRQFVQVGTVWTDQRHSLTQRTVQVKAFSPLYFELLSRLDGLRESLALGGEVLVAGKGVSVQVGPTGQERMSAGELANLVKAW